jgi:sodium-dependent dicarboxylate transporter 2/3/5
MAVLNVLEEKNNSTLIPDNEKPDIPEIIQVSETSGIDFADNKEYQDSLNFSKAVLLGVAYSASLGGTMTLIGTGTNLVSLQQLKIMFPNFPGYSFTKWFIFAFPLSSIMLALTWLTLSILFIWNSTLKFDKSVIAKEYEELGPLTYPQKFLIFEFILMVVLWFTRSEITEIGYTGWGKIFNNNVSDGTVAILISVILFFIPTNDPKKKKNIR